MTTLRVSMYFQKATIRFLFFFDLLSMLAKYFSMILQHNGLILFIFHIKWIIQIHSMLIVIIIKMRWREMSYCRNFLGILEISWFDINKEWVWCDFECFSSNPSKIRSIIRKVSRSVSFASRKCRYFHVIFWICTGNQKIQHFLYILFIVSLNCGCPHTA